MAQALGVDTRGLTDLQAADAAVDAVSALMKGIGAPMRLGDLGLTGEQVQARLPDIIAGTMSDLNGSTNPRPVTDPNAVAELVMATI